MKFFGLAISAFAASASAEFAGSLYASSGKSGNVCLNYDTEGQTAFGANQLTMEDCGDMASTASAKWDAKFGASTIVNEAATRCNHMFYNLKGTKISRKVRMGKCDETRTKSKGGKLKQRRQDRLSENWNISTSGAVAVGTKYLCAKEKGDSWQVYMCDSAGAKAKGRQNLKYVPVPDPTDPPTDPPSTPPPTTVAATTEAPAALTIIQSGKDCLHYLYERRFIIQEDDYSTKMSVTWENDQIVMKAFSPDNSTYWRQAQFETTDLAYMTMVVDNFGSSHGNLGLGASFEYHANYRSVAGVGRTGNSVGFMSNGGTYYNRFKMQSIKKWSDNPITTQYKMVMNPKQGTNDGTVNGMSMDADGNTLETWDNLQTDSWNFQFIIPQVSMYYNGSQMRLIDCARYEKEGDGAMNINQ